MIDIYYNGMRGSDIGVYASTLPNIPLAEEEVEEITIPGRSGTLKRFTKCFKSTEIPVELNFIANDENWHDKRRQIASWLSDKNQTLSFSDDSAYFYNISHVELSELKRASLRVGNITVTFVTTDGLSYIAQGLLEQDYKDVRYNPGIWCQPIYKITGEGVCNLIVNGKTVRVNVAQNLTIDTERMIAYREDGALMNASITGEYEDLYLNAGENTIEITNGFTCKVTPNWRCL